MEQNLEFILSSWDELSTHKGKFVVVTQHQGVFEHFEEARKVASNFRVSHTFLVDRKPMEKVIELGPEMEAR